jgi:hypothetical protein
VVVELGEQDGGGRGGQGGLLPLGGHALQGNLVGAEPEQAQHLAQFRHGR